MGHPRDAEIIVQKLCAHPARRRRLLIPKHRPWALVGPPLCPEAASRLPHASYSSCPVCQAAQGRRWQRRAAGSQQGRSPPPARAAAHESPDSPQAAGGGALGQGTQVAMRVRDPQCLCQLPTTGCERDQTLPQFPHLKDGLLHPPPKGAKKQKVPDPLAANCSCSHIRGGPAALLRLAATLSHLEKEVWALQPLPQPIPPIPKLGI